MKPNRAYLYILLFLLIISGLSTANGQPEPGIFERLSYKELLKVELTLDLDSLQALKMTELSLPATFAYKDKNGKQERYVVRIDVRGKFRRRFCQMPPLLITFPKKELQSAGMNRHNDLKLVPHCMDNEQGDACILREYLAYKLYQILTPHSFRVQLLQVKYRNSRDNTSLTRYALLLEDEDDLKERLGGKFCNACYGLDSEQFQPEHARLHDLFQYMIGNTDWSVPMHRNLKILTFQLDSNYLIVPYDFDFSGLVQAPYAIPDQTLGIHTVRERIYLGFPYPPEDLEPTIKLFEERKPALLRVVRNFKLLDVEERQNMIQYIESFYKCCINAGLDLHTPGGC